MAQLCATCGARKAHPTHLKAVAGASYHEFLDPRGAAKLANQSAGRTAYVKATDYSGRSKAARQEDCAFFAAGAPTEVNGVVVCDGTAHGIHHTAPRGRAGGLEAAERIGRTVAACNWHNTWASQDPEGIAWSGSHSFHQDGRDWPFLMSTEQIEAAR